MVCSTTYKLLILVFVTFTSCTRDELIDTLVFPPVESKAAVYCLLTPGDSTFAVVKTLQAISTKNYSGTQSIENARIVLLDKTTGHWVSLLYSGKNGIYGCMQQDLPIVPGNDYQLLIHVDSFPEMKASCQVPTKAATIDQVSYGEAYDSSLDKRRRVSLTWKDVSTTAYEYNYFLINKTTDLGYLSDSRVPDNTITQVDGTLYYNDDTVDSPKPHTYYLFTAEKNLFAFDKLAQQTHKIQYSRNGGDFFGGYQGIIPNYTNIENGYGVFGAYLFTSKTVSFK